MSPSAVTRRVLEGKAGCLKILRDFTPALPMAGRDARRAGEVAEA